MEQALITGASSGIGRAMAQSLAGAGYKVLAVGRSAQALAALAASHAAIEPLVLDVTDPGQLRAAVGGRQIDILISNAGASAAPVPFDRADMAVVAQMIALNLSATLDLVRLVLPGMRARGRGHVIFTGSSAAHQPAPGMAAYAATKAAISAFTDAIRAELAPDGVRVTEIVPGRVETGLYRAALDDTARAAIYAGGCAVQPEDIAAVLLAAIRLPAHASVTRFDVMPTRPVPPLGG